MNNKNKGSKNIFVVALLLLLVVGVSVGYAALSKTLNIKGTSNIAQDASWDVHFEEGSIHVTDGSANAGTPATISGDTVNFSVDLKTPGDFYEFTVDVVNTGTIAAKLQSTPTIPTIPANAQKYVTYTITDNEGHALSANDELTATSGRETVKVRLEFKKDITELPSDLEPLNLNFSMNYVQK